MATGIERGVSVKISLAGLSQEFTPAPSMNCPLEQNQERGR